MPDDLFAAFREDHAVLGRGFHRLSSCLRSADMDGARRAARALNRDAGPHIAFEEKHFYPALIPLLGKADVDRLFREHGSGLSVVRALVEASDQASWSEPERRRMLQASEEMERHIAECGELFEALGRLPEEDQDRLLRSLVALRSEGPDWLSHAGPEPEP
jgi:hypothetical protein